MRVLGVLALLLLVGFGLVGVSATMPANHDPARAEELLNMTQAPRTEPARQEFTQQWFDDMAEIRTHKWLIFDFGTGLILTAFSVFLLFSFARSAALWDLVRPSVSDRPKLTQIYGVTGVLKAQSPRARWRFLLYGTVLHFGFNFSLAAFFIIDELRGYSPFWSSTGLPVFGTVTLGVLVWPVLIVAGLFLLIPAKLPAILWNWNANKPIWSWFWTLLHAIPAGLIVLLLATSFTTQQALLIPFLIFGLYLIESSRSAGLAPRAPRGKTGFFSRLGLKRGP